VKVNAKAYALVILTAESGRLSEKSLLLPGYFIPQFDINGTSLVVIFTGRYFPSVLAEAHT
jgi:hypothetical protein